MPHSLLAERFLHKKHTERNHFPEFSLSGSFLSNPRKAKRRTEHLYKLRAMLAVVPFYPNFVAQLLPLSFKIC